MTAEQLKQREEFLHRVFMAINEQENANVMVIIDGPKGLMTLSNFAGTAQVVGILRTATISIETRLADYLRLQIESGQENERIAAMEQKVGNAGGVQ